MSIYSTSSPGPVDIKMAYNPILITVLTTGTNPIVYVDIYFNGTFYKTIAATSPSSSIFGFAFWQIDIRDAAQEFLASPPAWLAVGFPSLPMIMNDGIAACTCKVRGSSVTGGFVVPDGPAPIQGTIDSAPVAGGGSTMATWVVMNGALQLEEDPVPASNLLANNVGTVEVGYTFYNLFRNPRMRVQTSSYMRLPVYIPHGGLTPSGGTTEDYFVVIEDQAGNYYYPTTGGLSPAYATYSTYAEEQVYYIPAGPMNFASLGVAFGTPPDWSTITRYRIDLINNGLPLAGTIKWRSPWITVDKPCADTKRLQFVNWYGHYDTVVFDEYQEEYVTAAQGWEKYNVGNFSGLGKEAYGKQRYNVRSNERLTVNGYFSEAEMFFVKQMISNPRAYIETKGTAGQPDYLLAIRLLDVTVLTRKIDERYIYFITVQYEPANERINLRN